MKKEKVSSARFALLFEDDMLEILKIINIRRY
jgi:hypothetical protein